jgi:hypothetical protein
MSVQEYNCISPGELKLQNLIVDEKSLKFE